jgi:predicted PurR-regulated permease PerM
LRAVVVLTVLVGLFIWSGVVVQRYLTDTGRQLEDCVNAALTAAQIEKWTEAARLAGQLNTQWQQIKVLWGCFTEHDEIDDINGTLSRLQGAINSQDIATTSAEALAALQLFRHIPEKETFRLVNIL